MKKNILFLIIVLLAFAGGIWIDKSKLINQDNENQEEEVIDTAEVNAEKRFNNKYPLYEVAGGLPQEKDKYRYIIDNWYNFRFRVNGASCTDPSNNDIDVKRNHKTDSILKKRIGANWKEIFEKSVDSVYKIDSVAINIAENSLLVKKIINQKSVKNAAKHAQYRCYPTTNKELKLVSIEWRGLIYRDSTTVSFLRAVVDVKNRRVLEVEKAERQADMFY